MENAKHFSVIEGAFYSIKWAHNIAGVKNPCDSDVVAAIVEAARRKLNRPVKKKEPISADIMLKLFEKYNNVNQSLKDLRLLTLCA